LNVEVREAAPRDKEPLMSFIRKVWGGHDYIPHVWDDWLADKGSKMFVVLADGRQVGMNRVRFLEDGSAWFEGARIHPEFRGKGFATALGERSLAEARRRGIGVFRLTSSSWNKAAHRQIARIEFHETSRVSVYWPPSRTAFRRVPGVRRAGPTDAERVRSMIRSSDEFRLGAGVMWDTFAAIGLTNKVVDRAIARNQVYLNKDSVAIARTGGEGTQIWSQVSFAAGNPQHAVQLIKHLFAAGQGHIDRCFAYIPRGSGIIHGLREAGMKREFSLILFERRAANG
jgi:GNAT superfamily N-acetyltransferase